MEVLQEKINKPYSEPPIEPIYEGIDPFSSSLKTDNGLKRSNTPSLMQSRPDTSADCKIERTRLNFSNNSLSNQDITLNFNKTK